MDLLGPYPHGLGIGFAIAAAIGPIGLLCIRRTLAESAVVGLGSGWAPRPRTGCTQPWPPPD